MGIEAAKKAAGGENMAMDFGALFGTQPETTTGGHQSAQDGASGEMGMQTPETAKTPTRPPVGAGEAKREQSMALFTQHRKEADEKARSLEICRKYQENTVKTGRLQAEILKGIRAGENVYSLFLKAVEAIGLMCSDDVFYRQARADIEAIYGEGLHDAGAMEIQLEATAYRLSCLRKALENTTDMDSRRRIQKSIDAHQDSIKELTAAITEKEWAEWDAKEKK